MYIYIVHLEICIEHHYRVGGLSGASPKVLLSALVLGLLLSDKSPEMNGAVPPPWSRTAVPGKVLGSLEKASLKGIEIWVQIQM